MKHYIVICLSLLFLGARAQPVPTCGNSDNNKRLFIKADHKLLLCGLGHTNPSGLDTGRARCFELDGRYQADSNGVVFFEIVVYPDMNAYQKGYVEHKSASCMRIRIVGFTKSNDYAAYVKEKFNLYLNISYKNGDYLIDVSKLKTREEVLVPCEICFENWKNKKKEMLPALNITPAGWKKCEIK